MGSLISGILGGGQSDAQAGQTAALQQSRAGAQAYRPEAMQARLNLLNKASGAYQGMNNAMETMYGGRGPKVGGGEFAKNAPELPHAAPTFGGHPLPQQPQSPPMGSEGPPGAGQQRPQERPILSQVFDPAGIFRGLF